MAGRRRSGEHLWVMLITLVVLGVLGLVPFVQDVQSEAPEGFSGAAPSSEPSVTGAAPALAPDISEPSPVVPAIAAAEEAAARFGQRGLWGLAVLDRHTGDVALGQAGTQPVFAASLAKLILAVDILDNRRSQGLTVTDSDIDRLRRALGPSDDNAMNALWTRFDGVRAISRVSARLELTATRPPTDPSQWGEVMISAEDTAALWQYILDDMAEDGDLLVSWMAAAPPFATDGFDQRFGLLNAETADGLRVAKQGWMCCHSGEVTLHSSGAFGTELRYVAAVLTRQPRDIGWALARQRLTEVTNALINSF